MKTFLSLVFLMFMITVSAAQEITGDWYGVLAVPGQQLDLVFHISGTKDNYTTTMDSPKQNAFGIPVASTTYIDKQLQLAAPALGLQYEGELQGDTIAGTFRQGGMEFPLDLYKEKPQGEIETVKFNRPQEPKRPFPYLEEEVSFENVEDSVKLSGTLTLPGREGNFPAVVLISGSGPQDRNEEILGHKPFLIIADFLTRHGIAVLRYDDRGVGKSTGNFQASTSEDFARDARAAVEFLKNRKEINIQEIGIIGHSEGGMIAPMLASKDNDVSFLVLLAGPGLRGDKLLLTQQEMIFRARGESEENIQAAREANKAIFDIMNSSSSENLEEDLRKHIQQSLEKNNKANQLSEKDQEEIIDNQVRTFMNPWMHFFLTYDPSEALEKVNVPVLAVNGEMDLQVSAKENLVAIKNILEEGGNDNVTIKEYPGLNHLFQESTTGSPDEYSTIEQTFSPNVLEDIKNWILENTTRR